jgi:hypothetical protein
MIESLIPLNDLDIELEVKQLFIDVFQRDPLLRLGMMELLNRPIISSAMEYGCYFDECYDSEDAEDLEASPNVECDDSIPIANIPQLWDPRTQPGAMELRNNPIITSAVQYHGNMSISEMPQISLIPSDSQISPVDEVVELPQFPSGDQRLQLRRLEYSQDSGMGGDTESNFGSSAVFASQMSAQSLSSVSSRSGGNQQQRLSHQDSGLKDSLVGIGGECSQAGRK